MNSPGLMAVFGALQGIENPPMACQVADVLDLPIPVVYQRLQCLEARGLARRVPEYRWVANLQLHTRDDLPEEC